MSGRRAPTPSGATVPPSRGLAGLFGGSRTGGRGSAEGHPGPTPRAGRPKRSLVRRAGHDDDRESTAAGARRRQVEARLIGLPEGPGQEWWGPCWERGIAGDLPAAALFDELATFRPDVRVLHGVGVAGTGTTIDHVLVGTGGVVVAATERCGGKVRTDGVHLRVRGKDLSAVVDVALWRAEAVRAALERRGLCGIPVHGVLHWEHVEALGDRPICLRGIPLLSAGATLGLAAAGRELSPLRIERVADALVCDTHH